MTNQKYYVRLKSMDTYLIRDNPDKGGVIWIDEYKQSFTKSELVKIMDGALYKGHEPKRDCIRLGCEEWINPLIELVPVEEET